MIYQSFHACIQNLNTKPLLLFALLPSPSIHLHFSELDNQLGIPQQITQRPAWSSRVWQRKHTPAYILTHSLALLGLKEMCFTRVSFHKHDDRKGGGGVGASKPSVAKLITFLKTKVWRTLWAVFCLTVRGPPLRGPESPLEGEENESKDQVWMDG